MKRVLVVAGALLLSVGAVMAQQEVAKQTQTTMKATGRALGACSVPMVKGEKPYDQAAVDTALTQLARYRKEAADDVSGKHQGSEGRRRLQLVAEDLGRQGRLRSEDRQLRQGRDRSQGEDQGSRLAEGRPSLRSARNAAPATRRSVSRTADQFEQAKEGGARSVRPLFLSAVRRRTYFVPDRGFRRPDWLRCEC